LTALTVFAPGSCGELVQGVLDGVSFHVSCPVNVYSRAEVGRSAIGPKAKAAVKAAWALLGGPTPSIAVGVYSDLKPAVGMASSTADITAAVAASVAAAGRRITARDIARAALSVEPTDGTLFKGVVAFDHKAGRRLRRLGPAPPMLITYIDTGGAVDTIEYNRAKIRYSRSQAKSIGLAYELAAAGLRLRDRRLIGRGATLSALVNQAFLPKKELDELIFVARSSGGYGVVVAHSGTVAGIMHDKEPQAIADSIRHLGFGPPKTVRMVDGGWWACGTAAT
jgi:L-threonine kinase